MTFKRQVRRALAAVAPPVSRAGVRVLLYHAVDERDPADVLALRVSPRQFTQQMTLLRDEGYDVVPLRAVFDAARGASRPRVAITFDDGYTSQVNAAAVLRQLGMPATFFLAPRFLDGVRAARDYSETWRHMTWDDAASLVDGGFDVGAHSNTHVDLRQCSREQLDEEIAGAKDVLEARLQRPIRSFSYPYGRHDARVQRAVAQAGYEVACTSRYGLNRAPVPAFTVNRIEVTGRDSLQDFQWKLQGKYDWVGRWQDLTA